MHSETEDSKSFLGSQLRGHTHVSVGRIKRKTNTRW